jgi:exodeoxyribonuclease V beta subunit
VRGALVTDLLGATAERLAHYDATPAAWDAVQARFIAYRERAAKRGFIRMWRELLEGEGIPGRLLALPDGDRRLTNLQHLSELLQQAAARDGLDVGALARLLARQRAGRGGDTDAQLLRLESDEQLVRVLTIHAAKGLEFPVVFLPFLWDGPRRAAEDGPAVCHQAGGALIDFGTDDFDARAAAAQDEQRAEHLRLAYVALTRATQRCILAWGHVKDGDRSPLASLLHGAHGHAFRLFDEARLRADLAHLAAASGGAIAVQDLPLPLAPRPRAADASAGATLATRVFHGTIAAPWRVSSFSGLLARRALEAPDHDAQGPEAWDAPARPADSSQRTVFDFPGGTRAGTLIHALFERVDFADPGGERAATAVAEVLAAHRYESSWSPVLRTMLRDVLTTPLARGGWCLADIGEHARVTELEFLFPVDAGAPALAAGVAPPRGFLRGFIDLVFTHGERWYVLDWKSNRLGSRVEDYAAARLEQTMRESLYDLQYRLYTVALHRHLAARLPGYDYDRHFGGVFYLFVRGMRPAAGAANGVYFARPERADIESLSRALSPSRGHA